LVGPQKFAAQAIRKMAEIGWKPLHFLTFISSSVGVVIKPAGFEASQGVISSIYLKDPSDPYWKNDPGLIAWNEFLDKYYPDANRIDGAIIYAYAVAQTLVHVLDACGDNSTRENVMKQAASMKNLEPDGLLPGIKINTSVTNFAPISQVQMMRFKGETWERFGEVISSDVGG
jgi:branched-chain amino acid transport system substrate-binding protein